MPTPTTLKAAMDAADTLHPVRLSLSVEGEDLNTTVQLYQGRLTGVSSPLLPAWSSLLVSGGLPPQVVAEAQEVGFSPDGMLGALLAQGHLTPGGLERLQAERVLAALVPLALHDLRVSVTETARPARTEGVPVAGALEEAGRLAAGLTPAERRLTPGGRFYAVPGAAGAVADTPPSTAVLGTEDRVTRLASQGLPLGEIAARLPVRWDQLAGVVAGHLAAGTLGYERRSQSRNPGLRPGDLAPEFQLAALGGSELALGRLRGQKLWLVFGRQAGRLAGPRTAAITALRGPLQAAGVQVVSVWNSGLADLSGATDDRRPPYALLSDPHDEVYVRYHPQGGQPDSADLRTLPALLQRVGLGTPKAGSGPSGRPAEFLIDELGKVAHAHYSAYEGDWMPMERVLAWAALTARD